jgi:hypothetical protein
MGSFQMTSPTDQMAQPQSQAPPQSPMDSLMGNQVAKSPQQAEMEAQAGALDQLRQVEMAIGALSQIVQQMAAAYPGGAEPVRQTMAALDAAKQSLIGLLVPMMSGMPDAQPQGPAYMGS